MQEARRPTIYLETHFKELIFRIDKGDFLFTLMPRCKNGTAFSECPIRQELLLGLLSGSSRREHDPFCIPLHSGISFLLLLNFKKIHPLFSQKGKNFNTYFTKKYKMLSKKYFLLELIFLILWNVSLCRNRSDKLGKYPIVKNHPQDSHLFLFKHPKIKEEQRNVFKCPLKKIKHFKMWSI